ncbi:MAG: ribosome biogenesis factor YjgA [Gammaproteobacteria bacterium]|nr:MAG: ribosome biogenesis factor YjgA [Gammaproteobacteria bacterium]
MVIDDGNSSLSKSQRKRDALALQALADELVRLSPAQLDSVPLSDNLRAAVISARDLSRGAYRRQVRYLGRLLRDTDAAPIRSAVDAHHGASHEDKARLKRLERWRQRLIEEGDAAVAELLDEYPGADPQQLRQLVRNAHKEHQAGRAPRSYRQLFRFLREL